MLCIKVTLLFMARYDLLQPPTLGLIKNQHALQRAKEERRRSMPFLPSPQTARTRTSAACSSGHEDQGGRGSPTKACIAPACPAAPPSHHLTLASFTTSCFSHLQTQGKAC